MSKPSEEPGGARRGGEGPVHRRLKTAALAWAQRNGFDAVASEVRVPKGKYRADVAACRTSPGGNELEFGATAIFECKAQRSDFLGDSKDLEKTFGRMAALQARRARLERLLSIHHPHLLRGETLFPEFDRGDFEGLSHDGYHRVTKELATLSRRVYGGTKFSRMCRYSCADALYLVVAEGVIKVAEVPDGWGLLVARVPEDAALEEGEKDAPLPILERVRMPRALDPGAEVRSALLGAIARAATRHENRAVGLGWDDIRAQSSSADGVGEVDPRAAS